MTSTNARGMTANLGTTPDQNVLSYDGAGNMTSDGENLYLYDAEGRVCAVGAMTMPGQQQPSITGYIYDGDGVRVAKGTIPSTSVAGFFALGCDPSGWTGFQFTADYVLGPGGEQLTQFDGQGNWQRTNVYAAGKLVGTYDLVDNPSYTTGGTTLAKIPWLHFHFTDALGTRRMQVSGMIANLGQPETDFQSLPFGDQLATLTDPYTDPSANDATPLHFTGKERDAESGNDYFGARYYASSMGRFLSPDPISFQASMMKDPQRFNLYAYVRNNPLNLIDPTGEAIQLLGDYDARKKELDALKNGVGAKAGSYLYDAVVTDANGNVSHCVGILSGGPDGKGPSFDSINSASGALSGIVNDKEVASLSVVPSGTKLNGESGQVVLGAAPGHSPGFTDKFAGKWISYLMDTKDKSPGYLPGNLMSNGERGNINSGIMAFHELGHQWYGIKHPFMNAVEDFLGIGGGSYKYSLELENKVRETQNPGGATRTEH